MLPEAGVVVPFGRQTVGVWMVSRGTNCSQRAVADCVGSSSVGPMLGWSHSRVSL